MKIPDEQLKEWAQECFQQNGRLLHAADDLRRVQAPADTQQALETVRQRNWRMLESLVRAGADDPREERARQLREAARKAGFDMPEPEPVSLSLLSSPKARRYAGAIRAAASACQEMEQERGITDGLGEILSDYADIAEMETLGPTGLQGME